MSEPSAGTDTSSAPAVQRHLETYERSAQLERETAHKAAKKRVQSRLSLIIRNSNRVAAANASKPQSGQGERQDEKPTEGCEGDETPSNKAAKAAAQGNGNTRVTQIALSSVAPVTAVNRQKLENAFVAAHNACNHGLTLSLGGQLFPQHPDDLSDPLAQIRRWLGMTQCLARYNVNPFGSKTRNKLWRVSLDELYEAYEHAVLQITLRMTSLCQMYQKYPHRTREFTGLYRQDDPIEGDEKMTELQRSRGHWVIMRKECGLERGQCVNLTLTAICDYGKVEVELVRLREIYPDEAIFRRDVLHRGLVLEC